MYLAQKDEVKQKRNSKLVTQALVKRGIDQQRFDKMIVQYIINGLQPLGSVEDESFKQLIFGKYILVHESISMHIFPLNSTVIFDFHRHGCIFLWCINAESNVPLHFELQN